MCTIIYCFDHCTDFEAKISNFSLHCCRKLNVLTRHWPCAQNRFAHSSSVGHLTDPFSYAPKFQDDFNISTESSQLEIYGSSTFVTVSFLLNMGHVKVTLSNSQNNRNIEEYGHINKLCLILILMLQKGAQHGRPSVRTAGALIGRNTQSDWKR